MEREGPCVPSPLAARCIRALGLESSPRGGRSLARSQSRVFGAGQLTQSCVPRGQWAGCPGSPGAGRRPPRPKDRGLHRSLRGDCGFYSVTVTFYPFLKIYLLILERVCA